MNPNMAPRYTDRLPVAMPPGPDDIVECAYDPDPQVRDGRGSPSRPACLADLELCHRRRDRREDPHSLRQDTGLHDRSPASMRAQIWLELIAAEPIAVTRLSRHWPWADLIASAIIQLQTLPAP